MILVTGGTGLVGSHLLAALLQQGIAVRATYREVSDLGALRRRLSSQYPEIESRWEAIEWVRAPLSDIPALDTAVRGIRTLYHCAGLIDFDPRRSEDLLQTNWEGTKNLVNTALAAGVRTFCHVSSIATIGGFGETATESDVWDPNRTNVYATSKYLGEMEVWRGGLEGLETVIVNPGVILGAGDWERGSGRFFSAVAGGLRYALPGGTGFVGVRDVVRCMMGLTEGGHTGRRYILVSENRSYAGVFEDIARALRRPAPKWLLKPWLLEVLWRLDWLRSTLARSPRKISRDTARSLRHRKRYDNSRVKDALGFAFEPVSTVIDRCAKQFRERGS